MTSPTLSTRIRSIQDELNAINNHLAAILNDANHIGLAPFRVAHIQAAIDDNDHAWSQLNELATALELTGADHKP